MNPRNVSKQMTYSPTPAWELVKAHFDIDYTEMKKENPYVLSYLVKSYIVDSYSKHLKFFTDVSILENDEARAWFSCTGCLKLKNNNKEKRFYVGKGIIRFTAKIIALF